MLNRRSIRAAVWSGLVLGLLVVLSGCTELLLSSVNNDELLSSGQLVEPMAKRVIWRVPGDFATIQEAIDSPDVAAGHRILVGAGSHAGALVYKAVEIRGEEGAVIDSGPELGNYKLYQGFRLLAGSDGAAITHLTFEVDFPIMSSAKVDSVTVSHCTFLNPMQAVSNWSGSDWEISHNLIEDLRCLNGGGIGILIADRSGGTVTDNVVSYNTIRGVLTAPSDDERGGYNGSGIVIYADFRYGWPGAEQISGNRVIHNTVSLVSDSELVGVAAFELTDTRDDPDLELESVIFDNAIGFNDFRGTELQIALTPEELDDYNDISRNLGDNRGHGTHPSVFGPGEK